MQRKIFKTRFRTGRHVLVVVSDADLYQDVSKKFPRVMHEFLLEYFTDSEIVLASNINLFDIRLSERNRLEVYHHHLLKSTIKAIGRSLIRRNLHGFNSEIINEYWLSVIKSKRPRMILGIDLGAELLRVCEKENINIYEFQHGAFGNSQLKYFQKSTVLTYLVWDDHYASILESVGLRSITVGYPFPVTKLVSRNSEGVHDFSFLVCLSYDIENDSELSQLSSSEFGFLINLVEFVPEKNLHFRLHPVSYSRKISIEGMIVNAFPKAKFLPPDDLSNDLSKCDFLITCSSSSVIDAAFLQKITICNDKSNLRDLVPEWISKDWILSLPDLQTESIGTILRSELKKKRVDLNLKTIKGVKGRGHLQVSFGEIVDNSTGKGINVKFDE